MNIYSLSQLLGKIGEVEGKEWLEHQNYKVIPFQEILLEISLLKCIIDRLKRRKKPQYIKEDKLRISEKERFLIDIFGEKFNDMMTFYGEFSLLRKNMEKLRQERNFTRRGIGPDFVVKKGNDIAFVEVKVNEAELTKYQKTCFKLLKKYGFKTFVLGMAIEMNVRDKICLREIE